MGKKKTVPVYDFTGDLFGEEVRIPWNDGALEKLKAERLAEERKAAAAQKRTRRASSERETERAPRAAERRVGLEMRSRRSPDR